LRERVSEIEELAADHPRRSRSPHQLPKNGAASLRRQPELARRLRDAARRERDHRQTGRRSRRDAVHAMDGGPPAAHVVIVHARQVVVDQRVGVHHFDGGREVRGIPRPAGRPIRRQQ